MQSRTANRANAVRKRTVNACQRCRQHKIKCSGQTPCRTCQRRGVVCNFEFTDKKVLVVESHLNELQDRLRQYERQLPRGSALSLTCEPTTELNETPSFADNSSLVDNSTVAVNESQAETLHNTSQEFTVVPADISSKYSDWTENPLVSQEPSYITDTHGRLRYLGHSSTWAFSRQVLDMAYKKAYSRPLPETSMNIEGDPYGLNLQAPSAEGVEGLPSLEVSLFLLQTVKFHTTCLYHLFDETSFTANLYQFFDNPEQYAKTSRLWFAHYLIIMAFGKALSQASKHTEEAMDLFARGTKVLPGVIYLCHEPVLASEILCGIALYLQSIDHRPAAHVYIGQATRIALSYGLHAEIQITEMDDQTVQRCRKIWWTIYNLDRKLSSLMGSPNLVNDQDITTPLPNFSGSSTTTDAFAIYVKMSRLLGHVVGTVYGIDGTVNKTFLKTTKSVLRGIAELADDLAVLSSRCFGEISRLAADLNLAYHRCILLATRPVIFYLLKLRLESEHCCSIFPLPESVKGMVQACLDSAGQVLMILSNLKNYDMIENFLPFDLESVFSAGLVLHMVAYVHPSFLVDQTWRSSVEVILDAMVANKSLIARLRKAEIEELGFMFQNIRQKHYAATPVDMGQTSPADYASLPSLGPPFFDGDEMDDGLSGAQILDLVNALNEEDLYGLCNQDFE